MDKRELVEAAARAMCEAKDYNPDCILHPEMVPLWTTYRTEATAAVDSLLAKLREPTPEALKAGQHVLSEWLNDEAPIGETLYRQPAKAAFIAMLDTISGTE